MLALMLVGTIIIYIDRNVLGVSLSELSTQLPQRSPQSGFR